MSERVDLPTGRNRSPGSVSSGSTASAGSGVVPRAGAPAPARAPQQSLGELAAAASRDLSVLVSQEVQLAKTELSVVAKRAGIGAGALAAAAFTGLFALIFLSITLAFAIRGLGLPLGVGFLIVGLLYLIIAGIAALIGLRNLKKVSAPQRTIQTLKDDIAWIKKPTQAPPVGERAHSPS